jgi:hypothetical protein
VIVTRDSDYGASFDNHSILNDWLATEFRERVSKKRRLLLTDRLSSALKLASIPVTKQEFDAETRLLSERRSYDPKSLNLFLAAKEYIARARRVLEQGPESFEEEPPELSENAWVELDDATAREIFEGDPVLHKPEPPSPDDALAHVELPESVRSRKAKGSEGGG